MRKWKRPPPSPRLDRGQDREGEEEGTPDPAALDKPRRGLVGNHRRIIKSFDLVGASALVDSLYASQWCQNRPDDRDDYTKTGSAYLTGIQEELYDALGELPDLVAEFVEDELS
ncbi:MAG: hypothetical protein EOP84_01975 [Verrucomicrobiaceae bacterium]|nr:MAG: hypothetical protein EOP84_01975 [Verrucomicrobiaceae bacterium]